LVLSQWATVGRYPGNWPEATDQDARDAVRQARAVWETVLDDLDRHGMDGNDISTSPHRASHVFTASLRRF
jgi:hypothetical protein